MARTLSRIHVLSGTLEVEGELSIGTGRAGVDADIEVIRDGLGRLIIPGESLAGALVRMPGVARWDGQLGLESASPIWIEDAIEKKTTVTLAHDHGNRDRHTGGAADKGLFTREVVPHGAQFTFEIRVEESPGEEESASQTVMAVATALNRGVALGAARTRGSGQVRWTVAPPEVTTYDTSIPAGLLADLLRNTQISQKPLKAGRKQRTLARFSTDTGVAPPSPAPRTLVITLPWSAQSPILVSVAAQGVANMIPELERRQDGWYGRVGLRQALRTIAERIERTVASEPSPSATSTPADPSAGETHETGSAHADSSEVEAMERGTVFSKQLLDPNCLLTQVIFGAEAGRNHGRAGAWTQGHSLTTLPVATEPEWKRVLDKVNVAPKQGEERKAVVELRKALPQTLVLSEHIRLEAWSGGPVPGALFSLLAIRSHVCWQPATIAVDLDRLAEVHEATINARGQAEWSITSSPDQRNAALALILLVLREACSGEAAAGMGASRGLGEIAISASDVGFATDPHGAAGFLNGKSLADLLKHEDTMMELQKAWERRIDGTGGAS